MAQEFLSAFSPRQMAPETLEELFVAREEIASRLQQAVRDSARRGVKRHSLIVGPRGMGKTHLLSVLYNRLRAEKSLEDSVRFARLSEEEYGLLSFFHVLRRTLEVLAETYADAALKQTVASLRGLSVAEAQTRAEAALRDFLGDKTLVILAENFDDILKQLKDSGQRALRAFLQTQQQTLLLVATPSLSHSLVKNAAPFYGFFEVTHLKDLDAVQGRELLIKLAELRGNGELVASLRADGALPKLRAVEHLAGGHPRLWFFFADVLAETPLSDLSIAFQKLIEQLTPYYHSKMMGGQLSDQERAIIEAIALRREPVPVKEIAADCFLEPNVVSANLSRLAEERFVRPERAGRESYYELAEPLLRLHLESKSSQGSYLPIIVQFLVGWFNISELKFKFQNIEKENRKIKELVSKSIQLKKRNLRDARLIGKNIEEAEWKADFYEDFTIDYFEVAFEMEKIILLKGADSTIEDWMNCARINMFIGNYEKAISYLDVISKLNKKDCENWNNLGIANYQIGNYERAVSAYKEAINIKKDSNAWFNLGVSLSMLDKYSEADNAYDEAIKINGNIAAKFAKNTILSNKGFWKQSIVQILNLTKNEDIESYKNIMHVELKYLLLSFIRKYNIHELNSIISFVVNSKFDEDVFEILGKGLIGVIPELMAENIKNTTSDTWLEAWRVNGEGKKELEIPIRLLSAAVEWKKTRHRRALLKLPIEERKILETLLPPEARGEA